MKTSHDQLNDPYPFHVPIEIDRQRLRKYLRVKWLLAWTISLCGFGALLGLAGVSKRCAEQSQSVAEATGVFATGIGIGGGLGLILGLALYFSLSHWLARRMAEGLELSVEGS